MFYLVTYWHNSSNCYYKWLGFAYIFPDAQIQQTVFRYPLPKQKTKRDERGNAISSSYLDTKIRSKANRSLRDKVHSLETVDNFAFQLKEVNLFWMIVCVRNTVFLIRV